MERLSSLALGDTPEDVIRAAVDGSRNALKVDASFAAIPNGCGGYNLSVLNGVHEPRVKTIVVRPGLGLGGQVLARSRPLLTANYAADTTITPHFKPIIGGDRLRTIACVPVDGPNGCEFLLYGASRTVHGFGDVALDELRRIADYASIGLHHLAARRRAVELERLRDRERLATQMHDSVAQLLFGIGVTARQAQAESDPELLALQLRAIEQTSADARGELRAALATLSRCPDDIALESAIDAERKSFELSSGRSAWLTRRGDSRRVSPLASELLLDAVREGLRNTAKHAGNDTGAVVAVHLAYQPERVVLAIQSESPEPAGAEAGRPRASRHELQPGSGLWSLRERARRQQGELQLRFEDSVAILRLELPTTAGTSARG